jgi:hypothetical protein
MEALSMSKGIAVYLEKASNGTVQLVFDDVVSNGAGSWQKTALFTNREISLQQLLEFSFTEKELADVGLNLLARLQAIAESAA